MECRTLTITSMFYEQRVCRCLDRGTARIISTLMLMRSKL